MEYLRPRYGNMNLPLYCSAQKGRKVLTIPHFHEGIELIRVKGGEVECFVGTEKHICRKGDIIFIPPSAFHSVYSMTEEAEIQGLVYEFSAIGGQEFGLPLVRLLDKDRITQHLFKPFDGINARLNEIFAEITENYNIRTPVYELEMRGRLCQLTALLAENYYSDAGGEGDQGRLEPVIRHIKANFKEDLTISELSRLLNLCDDHFIRIFRKIMGVTPAKYISNVRLEEAQKLLINTDASITEISYAVGFSSVGYMSKVFRDVFGVTPMQYRKKR